jgi:hypothetical protein
MLGICNWPQPQNDWAPGHSPPATTFSRAKRIDGRRTATTVRGRVDTHSRHGGEGRLHSSVTERDGNYAPPGRTAVLRTLCATGREGVSIPELTPIGTAIAIVVSTCGPAAGSSRTTRRRRVCRSCGKPCRMPTRRLPSWRRAARWPTPRARSLRLSARLDSALQLRVTGLEGFRISVPRPSDAADAIAVLTLPAAARNFSLTRRDRASPRSAVRSTSQRNVPWHSLTTRKNLCDRRSSAEGTSPSVPSDREGRL